MRWVVDGERYTKAFTTRTLADRYRSRLLVAQQDGERFDHRAGEPVSWAPAPDEMPVYEWARRWVAEEWQDWAPRTQDSAVEALSRFIPLVVDRAAPEPPPGTRMHVRRSLRPDATPDAGVEAEKWLDRWGLTLGQLDRERLADVEQRLGVGDAGQPLAAATAARYRKNARTCIRRAVELGRLDTDPWPPNPKGRSRRKARKVRRAVDVRRLPDPKAMGEIIAAIRTHQPGSRNYELMTAIAYFAGLRPSETVMLRAKALALADEGWGHIDVVEADVGWDEPGEPKTGDRTVPIPPQLVRLLRDWITEHGLGPNQLLFRTRNDRRPTPSNWSRALHRACLAAGHPPMRVYDARHACATAWLSAGVPLGEVARRLGHSVETLVSTYVGALDSDAATANTIIDATLSAAWAATTKPPRADLVPRRATRDPTPGPDAGQGRTNAAGTSRARLAARLDTVQEWPGPRSQESPGIE